MMLLWMVITIVILFGTVLLKDVTQADSIGVVVSKMIRNANEVRTSMLSTAIADSLCGGSNIWAYMCLLTIPHGMMMI